MQVRETIGVGLKRISTMNSATNRAIHKVSKRLSAALGTGGGDSSAAAAREASARYNEGSHRESSASARTSGVGGFMRGFSKKGNYQGSDSAAWED